MGNFIDLFRNMPILNEAIEELYEKSKKDPHRSLYLSVIFQALLDVTKPKIENEKNEMQLLRDQAHAWFFTSVGVTCENFEFICTYAGLPVDHVRRFVSHVINSDSLPHIRQQIIKLLG